MGIIVDFLSGEFLLRKNANGGGVIVARSLWVSVWVYMIGIGLKSWTGKDATLSFSGGEFRAVVNETLPWLGAIFAATYAAFYARFSNHCAYLAALYNQIMSVKAAMADDDKAYGTANRALTNWQVGFIVDARAMHLANKELFRGVVISLLAEPHIDEAFKEALGKRQGGGDGWKREYDDFRALVDPAGSEGHPAAGRSTPPAQGGNPSS